MEHSSDSEMDDNETPRVAEPGRKCPPPEETCSRPAKKYNIWTIEPVSPPAYIDVVARPSRAISSPPPTYDVATKEQSQNEVFTYHT